MSEGRVHGTVQLLDCIKVSTTMLEQNTEKHMVTDLTQIKYTQTFAWILSAPHKYSSPLRFLPKQGARQWITLDYPSRGKVVGERLQKAKQVSEDVKQFDAIARDMCVEVFEASKNPYWRVRDNTIDFMKKFHFVCGNPESRVRAGIQAMEVQYELALIEDEVLCLTSPELKEWMIQTGLSKTGSKDVLQARMIRKKLDDVLYSKVLRSKVKVKITTCGDDQIAQASDSAVKKQKLSEESEETTQKHDAQKRKLGLKEASPGEKESTGQDGEEKPMEQPPKKQKTDASQRMSFHFFVLSLISFSERIFPM